MSAGWRPEKNPAVAGNEEEAPGTVLRSVHRQDVCSEVRAQRVARHGSASQGGTRHAMEMGQHRQHREVARRWRRLTATRRGRQSTVAQLGSTASEEQGRLTTGFGPWALTAEKGDDGETRGGPIGADLQCWAPMELPGDWNGGRERWPGGCGGDTGRRQGRWCSALGGGGERRQRWRAWRLHGEDGGRGEGLAGAWEEASAVRWGR